MKFASLVTCLVFWFSVGASVQLSLPARALDPAQGDRSGSRDRSTTYIAQSTPEILESPLEFGPLDLREFSLPKPIELQFSQFSPTQPRLESTIDTSVMVEVRDIEVLGNTVFSEAEIDAIAAEFEGKRLAFEDLLALRTAVTDLYTSNGYTTSGAFLPPQDVSDGVVQIQAVEGQLERIEVTGLSRLSDDYVRDRLELATRAPIRLSNLEAALQLLQQDAAIQSIRADLSAGTRPGLSVLSVDLSEADPIGSSLTIENRDSPSVGSIRYSAALAHHNLLGRSDRLGAEFGLTGGVDTYNVSYGIPLNPRNGTLSLSYDNSRSTVIEEPFDDLDIRGRTETFSLGFRQPIRRTPSSEITLGIAADVRRSRTFIFDDEPFSFSEGPEDGESNITALRLTQEWVDRTPTRVFAARSQFSVGLDVFNATLNEGSPDGRFVSWLGQVQWVQSLGTDSIAIARLATQLTGDSLLPIEQFSLGGIDTVRGYRQNQRVGDSGIVGSVEVRLPLVRDRGGFGLVQLAPFFDIGTAWNQDGDIPDPSTLASVGLGLRWELNSRLNARVDWGIPLAEVDDPGDSLQDEGIIFSIRYSPF